MFYTPIPFNKCAIFLAAKGSFLTVFFFTLQQNVIVQKSYISFTHANICAISRPVQPFLFYFIAGEFKVLLNSRDN